VPTAVGVTATAEAAKRFSAAGGAANKSELCLKDAHVWSWWVGCTVEAKGRNADCPGSACDDADEASADALDEGCFSRGACETNSSGGCNDDDVTRCRKTRLCAGACPDVPPHETGADCWHGGGCV